MVIGQIIGMQRSEWTAATAVGAKHLGVCVLFGTGIRGGGAATLRVRFIFEADAVVVIVVVIAAVVIVIVVKTVNAARRL